MNGVYCCFVAYYLLLLILTSIASNQLSEKNFLLDRIRDLPSFQDSLLDVTLLLFRVMPCNLLHVYSEGNPIYVFPGKYL